MKKIKLDTNQALCMLTDLLARRDYTLASKLLWPFLVKNEQAMKIWNALSRHNRLCIMGHGSAGKTFLSSVYFLLDWMSDPEETATVITSDTIASMKRRIWSDFKFLLTKANETLNAQLPFEIMEGTNMIRYVNGSKGDLLQLKDGKNAIHAIAAESDDAQTKVQGLHTKRVRVVIDEADNKHSESIWGAIANLGTSGDLKCVALANPVDRYSEFGQHCEPLHGWDSINPDLDFEWESKRGWHVLRLDGLQSPNIKDGKDTHRFLLTNDGVEQILRDNGENSPEYWCYVRAWFPPESTLSTVFIPSMIDGCIKNKIMWYADIERVASFDPAMDGGDQRIACFGTKGRLAKDHNKTSLRVDKHVNIKRKDTTKEPMIDYCEQFIDLCKLEGIKPSNCIIDGTGTTVGFAEYIRHKWSHDVKVTNFAGECTDMRVTAEDLKPPKEKYDRFVTELWFAAREWCRLGYVELADCPRELRVQLESRNYTVRLRKVSIESKKEMKARGLGSPDYGDAFCMLIHLMRLTEKEFTLSAFKQSKPSQNFKTWSSKWASNYDASYGVK